MLPSTSPWQALFACPPSPIWNLISFTVESTLSSPSSRSDPPVSHQGTALAHLDSFLPHDLVVWTDGSDPFGKGGLAYLPTALSMAQRPFLYFRQAQYPQVFALKPAPFCKLFTGLGSTNKPATSLFFFSHQTFALASPLCPFLHLSFYLNLSGRSGRHCVLSPPVLSGYNGSPDTHSSQGTMQLMS